MSPLPYVLPALPSPQVKIIHEYLKYYSEFDFEGFSKVTTNDFTQQTWPSSLGQPIRPRAEEIVALKELRDALGGKPMQVSKSQLVIHSHKCQSALQLTIYDIDDGLGKTWVHVSLFLLLTDSILILRRSAEA